MGVWENTFNFAPFGERIGKFVIVVKLTQCREVVMFSLRKALIGHLLMVLECNGVSVMHLDP